MKNIQLKIWPDLTDYTSALVPLKKGIGENENNFTIDLGNIVNVGSTGLNFALINLLKIAKDFPNRKWDIIEPTNLKARKEIKDLGFFNILNAYINTYSLFPKIETINIQSIQKNSNGELKTLFPLCRINFNDYQNRRDALEPFRDYVFEIISKISLEYKLATNVLVTILNEIAKNSADHTDDNAFLGIELCKRGDELKINFSFTDFGIGICQTVKNFHATTLTELRNRARHMSLYEAYYWALKSGFTTKKKSKLNKGIGMSMIYNSSKELNLNLLVFDAESMGKLSLMEEETPTHASLRKIFYDIGNKVGFYYFGELIVDKIKTHD